MRNEAYSLIKRTTQSLQEKVERWKDVMQECDSESGELNLGALGVQNDKKSKERRLRKFVSREKGKENSGEGEKDSHVVREIRDLVKEVLAELRDVKLEIQKMNLLHQREAETLTRMYPMLNQLMGQLMSTTVWPKRPYFCRKDVNLCHRIAAMIEIGKPLRLHFQCEEIHAHHIVPDQPGYGITVGRENCEALRQISKSSVRVMRYMLKAGLHVSVGMAELVPELETSDRNTTSLTSSSIVRLLGRVLVQDGRSSNQTYGSLLS